MILRVSNGLYYLDNGSKLYTWLFLDIWGVVLFREWSWVSEGMVLLLEFSFMIDNLQNHVRKG